MIRTVFGLVEIGSEFKFISNPIAFKKVSDFTALVISSPYCDGHSRFDDAEEEITCSILDGRFSTDSIVDIESESLLCFDIGELND